jgi:hypothetical protein
VAFVLFVFLMASSVLVAGAPLRHAWFMLQPVKLSSAAIDPGIASLLIAELVFALSFMLLGPWFLQCAILQCAILQCANDKYFSWLPFSLRSNHDVRVFQNWLAMILICHGRQIHSS